MKKPLILLGITLMAIASCGEKPLDYKALHKDAIVVDLHSDTPMRMKRGIDFAVKDTSGHMDLPRLIEGGIDLQVFAVFLSANTPPEECRPLADEIIDSIESQFNSLADKIEICRSASEAERIIGEGKIAAFIGIENGVAIANDLDNLEHYFKRGVRYMTLTHTASNDWCISSADTMPAFDGLTDFGHNVVTKMNELGIIIDISHSHPLAVAQTLKTSKDPVIASHSCVYALCPHNRNLNDEQIEAIAKNGGVIGINFFNSYLSAEWNEKSDSIWDILEPSFDSIQQLYQDNDSLRRAARGELYDIYKGKMKDFKLTTADMVDHIDYIVNLVGSDYVGLGSDYDGVPSIPEGISDCSMVPNITAELVKRGYSETDIRKILGGNFMRVFKQVCDN